MRLLDSLRRLLHLRSLDPSDYSQEGARPDSIVDAEAAAGHQSYGYPPGYVKDYDDGRPRH